MRRWTYREETYSIEDTLWYSTHVSNKGAITFCRRRSGYPRLLFSMAMSARGVSSKEQYTIRNTTFHSIYNLALVQAINQISCYTSTSSNKTHSSASLCSQRLWYELYLYLKTLCSRFNLISFKYFISRQTSFILSVPQESLYE